MLLSKKRILQLNNLKMLESKLQAQMIREANKVGFMVVKIIRCNINGMSDLILLKNSVTTFVEVKTESGVHSELQKYVGKQLEKQGFEYHLVRSMEEFKELIKKIT